MPVRAWKHNQSLSGGSKDMGSVIAFFPPKYGHYGGAWYHQFHDTWLTWVQLLPVISHIYIALPSGQTRPLLCSGPAVKLHC